MCAVSSTQAAQLPRASRMLDEFSVRNRLTGCLEQAYRAPSLKQSQRAGTQTSVGEVRPSGVQHAQALRSVPPLGLRSRSARWAVFARRFLPDKTRQNIPSPSLVRKRANSMRRDDSQPPLEDPRSPCNAAAAFKREFAGRDLAHAPPQPST